MEDDQGLSCQKDWTPFPSGPRVTVLVPLPWCRCSPGSVSPERPRHSELVESTGLLVGFPAGPAGHVQTACRGTQMRFEETVRKS